MNHTADRTSLSTSLLVLAFVLTAVFVAAIGLKQYTSETVAAAGDRERHAYLLWLVAVVPATYLTARLVHHASRASDVICLLLWLTFCAASWPALRDIGTLVLTTMRLTSVTVSTYLVVWIGAAFLFHIAAMLFRWQTSELVEKIIWVAMITVGVVVIVSSGVSGIAAVDERYRWSANFEPVLYSISQVAGGRTLLADLPTQYGLYAEFLGPIFKLFGFSVFGITAIFAGMSAISFLCLAYVFRKVSRTTSSRIFWALGTVLLVNFIWQYWNSDVPFEPYYQYFPIRLFFPAVGVLLFYQFVAMDGKPLHAALIGAFLMCGVIWNLDAGIPAIGAFGAYFVLSALTSRAEVRKRHAASAVCLGIGAAVAIGLFATYMTLKAGRSIPWGEWLHYQRIFYITGAYGILLPKQPHPWMVALALYVIGVFGFFRLSSKRDPSDVFWPVMLYLSILGLGLFSYYQHRAHDMVLLAAAWPAFFMAFALVDRLSEVVERGEAPRIALIAAFPAKIVGAVVVGFFIYHLPMMIEASKLNWIAAMSTTDSAIQQNLRFIREKLAASGSNSLVIVAPNQAVYFAELGLPSTALGAGQGESFLPEDQQDFANRSLTSGAENIFIRSENGEVPALFNRVVEDYTLLDRNQNGMLYFRLRNGAP